MRTMGRILINWRITLASLFAVVVIGGAYLVARSVESPDLAQASTETELLKAIATRDSSGDGLPDWQKVLYGIPLHATTTDYFNLGMTDGEAVARGLIVPKAAADVPTASSTSAQSDDGVTGVFARTFFALYLDAKKANGGTNLSDAQSQTLAEQALDQIAETYSPAPDFKTLTDLKVVSTSPEVLRTFAATAESVIRNQKNDATQTDVAYLEAALDGDGTAITHLTSLARSHRETAVALAALSVPSEIAPDYLVIINGMMRFSAIDADFALVNTDPFAAILALQQYQDTLVLLVQAFTHLASVYASKGVVLPAGTPGATFVNPISAIQPQLESIPTSL